MESCKPYSEEELKNLVVVWPRMIMRDIYLRLVATIAERDKTIEGLQGKYDKLYNETVRTHGGWNDIAIEADKELAALQAEVARLTTERDVACDAYATLRADYQLVCAQNVEFRQQDTDYMAKIGALEGMVDLHEKQVERGKELWRKYLPRIKKFARLSGYILEYRHMEKEITTHLAEREGKEEK